METLKWLWNKTTPKSVAAGVVGGGAWFGACFMVAYGLASLVCYFAENCS